MSDVIKSIIINAVILQAFPFGILNVYLGQRQLVNNFHCMYTVNDCRLDFKRSCKYQNSTSLVQRVVDERYKNMHMQLNIADEH
jgi:hypothetical protein